MAEELYFIKTNPVVAKINLYHKLCREEETVINFLDEDKKTSLEIIKNKVKNSVETLTEDEFFKIIHWITDRYKDHQDDEHEMQLFINGMDLFYEIPSKTPVRHFHDVICDYMNFIGRDFEIIITAEDFNNFLVYGIFSTGILSTFVDEHYYNTEADPYLLTMMDILKSSHENLYHFAKEEFNANIETLKQDIIDMKKVAEFNKANLHTSFSYPSEFTDYLEKEKHILGRAAVNDYFLELYQLTRYYHGNILKLHSW